MIIGIVSGKGGVGKTTLTANLGAVLTKEFGKKVLVIDGNITVPSLGIHLGMLSQENTLDDILEGKTNFHQATYIHPSGLRVVPATLSVRSEYPDTELLKEKLEEIKKDYDIILIDGAAGIGREVISVIKASDTLLVITNPEMTSVLAAIKTIKISKSLNVLPLGVVVNKVRKEKYELKISDIEELCETKVIATIPYDKKISESIKKMTPIALYDNSNLAYAFKYLVAYMIGVEYKKETFLDKLRKIFRLG